MEVEGLIYPRRILNLKNHLIVSEHKADTLIRIIDKKNGIIVKSVGIPGFGPGEIDDVPWRLYPVNNEENEFLVFSLMSKKLDRFYVSGLSGYSAETIKFKEILPSGRDFLFSSDSTFMSIIVDGNDKFVEFDVEGKVIQRYDKWDHMLDDKHLPPNVVSMIHAGYFDCDLSRNFFSLACLNVDRIELLNKEEGTITFIRGPIKHVPEFTVDHSSGFAKPFIDLNTIKYCYTNSVFGESKLYTLFSGNSAHEVNVAPEGRYNNDIYVFDFEGNVLEHYRLDHTIAHLAVDERERKFYGITFKEDPADIIVFDF